MTKIDGRSLRISSGVRRARSRSRASGSSFDPSDKPAIASTPETSPLEVSESRTIDEKLLALQTQTEENNHERDPVKRALQGLGQLAEIHLRILSGQINTARLKELRQQLDKLNRHRLDDDHLSQITREAEVRIAVELAKLGIE